MTQTNNDHNDDVLLFTMMNNFPAAAAAMTAATDSSNTNTNPLSRASLYAPLSNYNDNPGDEYDDDNNNNVGQQQARKRPRRTPKSLTESSLIQFLQSVSVDYHRNNNNNSNTATASSSSSSYHYGYNSGIRPLGERDVTDAIQSRALLLVGGRRHYNHGMINKPAKGKIAATTILSSSSNSTGIAPGLSSSAANNNNKNKAQTTKKKQTVHQILPIITTDCDGNMPTKRRRQRPRGINNPNGKCSIPHFYSTQAEEEEQEIDFLMQLNHLWNEYACTILLQLLSADSHHHARRDSTSTTTTTTKTTRGVVKGPRQQQQQQQQQQHELIDVLAPENQARLIDLCGNNTESILHSYWRNSTAAVATGETAATTTTMEWVGAMVRIEQCLQHASWIGLSGILVAVTVNTWQLMQIELLEVMGAQNNDHNVAKMHNGHDDDEKGEAKNGDCPQDWEQQQQQQQQQQQERHEPNMSSSSSPQWTLKRRLIVPKRGSSLSVLLPIPPTMDSDETDNKKQCGGFNNSSNDNAASHTLRITLHGSQTM